MLLHQRGEFRAEAGGQRRLVHDHAAPRLLHRADDRIEIERDQRAKIEDFRVDAGLRDRRLRDVDHRAVSEDRQRRAGATNRRLAERRDVMPVRRLAELVLRPGRDRAIVMAVERAVVEPLRLEKNHRVGVLDRGDQQPLGVVRVGRHHDLQSSDMREQSLRTLTVRLTAENAAARRHAHDHRAGELPVRAIAQPCGLRDDLVIGGIDVVGELNLDAGAEAVGRHANRRADDAEFADRRVETAAFAVFALQAERAAEDAAEIADILAEHDDVVVALHADIHRAADRLDHRDPRHRATPPPAGAGGAGAAASARRRPRTFRAPKVCRPRAAYRGARPPSAP